MAIWAAVFPAGCAHPPAADQFFSPPQLQSLVTGRTLQVSRRHGKSYGTLLYLAKDGTGWLGSLFIPGYPPQTGGMSMVIDWRILEGSHVCLWASPRIGQMPSFTPAFYECLQVLRSRAPAHGLEAIVTREGRSRTGPLEIYPGNTFPAPVIDQYLTQARILYGGEIPTWPIPPPGYVWR